eukprot:1023090-Rhodomonas_salina.1
MRVTRVPGYADAWKRSMIHIAGHDEFGCSPSCKVGKSTCNFGCSCKVGKSTCNFGPHSRKQRCSCKDGKPTCNFGPQHAKSDGRR